MMKPSREPQPEVCKNLQYCPLKLWQQVELQCSHVLKSGASGWPKFSYNRRMDNAKPIHQRRRGHARPHSDTAYENLYLKAHRKCLLFDCNAASMLAAVSKLAELGQYERMQGRLARPPEKLGLGLGLGNLSSDRQHIDVGCGREVLLQLCKMSLPISRSRRSHELNRRPATQTLGCMLASPYTSNKFRPLPQWAPDCRWRCWLLFALGLRSSTFCNTLQPSALVGKIAAILQPVVSSPSRFCAGRFDQTSEEAGQLDRGV